MSRAASALKRSFLTLLVASLALGPLAHAETEAKPTKFKRALVLAGGGMQTPLFLGVLDGVMADEKKAPDVIIGTCGSSIAAAIANALPDPEDRKAFILSEEYYSFLTGVKAQNKGFFYMLKQFITIFKQSRQKGKDQKLPKIFDKNFLYVTRNKEEVPRFNIPFGPGGIVPNEDGTRMVKRVPVILVSGEIHYTPEEAKDKKRNKRNDRKLFTETYFTDSETAKVIGEFKSATSTPENPINEKTAIVIDKTLFEGMRSSVSDFWGMDPMTFDGRYFLTGAINLYPIELGYHVANEVVTVYKRPFNRVFQWAMKGMFRYDNNERLRGVTSSYADYWVDVSDTNILAETEFGPKINKLKTKIKLDIPKTFEEFRTRTEALWNYGFERGQEAMAMTEKNVKSHIRQKTAGNTELVGEEKSGESYETLDP